MIDEFSKKLLVVRKLLLSVILVIIAITIILKIRCFAKI